LAIAELWWERLETLTLGGDHGTIANFWQRYGQKVADIPDGAAQISDD
jgi:hypothetical protein